MFLEWLKPDFQDVQRGNSKTPLKYENSRKVLILSASSTPAEAYNTNIVRSHSSHIFPIIQSVTPINITIKLLIEFDTISKN